MAGENSPYLQFKPGSFFGGSKIYAGSRSNSIVPGTGSGTGFTARRQGDAPTGLNAHYLAQRDKTRSMADINREASIGNQLGLLYNPNLGGYLNDSMYNRSGMGYQNPYAGTGQPQALAMTEPQMEWARKAQEKQTGAGALGKIGEKMANMTPVAGINPMFGAGMQAVNTAMQGILPPPVAPNPYAINRPAKPRSPEDITAERKMLDEAKRGVEYTTRGNTTSFTSPYGRGRITRNMGPGKPQSMVKDDFGRMVPMADYLANKRKVQASKGMI